MSGIRIALVSVTMFITSFLSNLALAAADAPLNLSQAKRYFNESYSIFSRKWMYDSSKFGDLPGLFDVTPEYDVQYRYEREYVSLDDGIARSAIMVFGNYCVFNQGVLVTDYQDQMFCLKNGHAFAHMAWESDWRARMATKFILQADVYANDAYRDATQYKPATRIIFAD